ncbi:MAG: hypothetical protein K7J46_20765 [Bryobacter sp.]|jgi:hypothetical protein|nr:hypothetical protein [Bryobacter sp. CoA8 C33]
MQQRRVFLLSGLGAVCGAQQPPAGAVAEYPHISPRTAPADYQAQGKAGAITIAADFVSHAVPTPEGTFKSEDFVAVEVGVYGEKVKLSFADFSLKINDRKMPIPASPHGAAMRGLSDPEWAPPKVEDDKQKRNPGDPPPVTPKMPFPLRRVMELKVQKSALPEGDRALPVAGLVFFPYRGKDEGITRVELIYAGEAGTATLVIER